MDQKNNKKAKNKKKKVVQNFFYAVVVSSWSKIKNSYFRMLTEGKDDDIRWGFDEVMRWDIIWKYRRL